MLFESAKQLQQADAIGTTSTNMILLLLSVLVVISVVAVVAVADAVVHRRPTPLMQKAVSIDPHVTSVRNCIPFPLPVFRCVPPLKVWEAQPRLHFSRVAPWGHPKAVALA